MMIKLSPKGHQELIGATEHRKTYLNRGKTIDIYSNSAIVITQGISRPPILIFGHMLVNFQTLYIQHIQVLSTT